MRNLIKPWIGSSNTRAGLYPVGSDCVLYHSYWRGDATDNSSYGNNGDVQGASFVDDGLSFDGTDDYVGLTAANITKIRTSDFAFFFWANVTATGSFPYLYFSTFGANNPRIEIWFDHTDSYKMWEDFILGRYRCPDTVQRTGEWHLFGWEVDRDVGAYLSIDGETVRGPLGVTAEGDLNDNANDAYIGKYPEAGGPYPFKGTIGEIYQFIGTYGTYSGGTRADLYNATKSRYGL